MDLEWFPALDSVDISVPETDQISAPAKATIFEITHESLAANSGNRANASLMSDDKNDLVASWRNLNFEVFNRL